MRLLGSITAVLLLTCTNAFAGDERSPDRFRVKFETSKGEFTVEVVRKWSPLGADHFHTLVKEKFYDECRFFRVMPGFIAQWGINGNPEVHEKWGESNILDEAVVASNLRGFMCYAKSDLPHTRSTQLFINLAHNSNLDDRGFAPFGRVVDGIEVVQTINSEYGQEPDQERIEKEGNAYLAKEFPNLDFIKTARIVTK